MADAKLLERLLAEVEGMRRHLDEVARLIRAMLEEESGTPGAAQGPAARASPDHRAVPVAGRTEPAAGSRVAGATPEAGVEGAPARTSDAARAAVDAPGQGTGGGQIIDFLDLADDFRKVMTLVIRSGGMTIAKISEETGEDESNVRVFLKTLLNQGHVRRETKPDGTVIYRAVIGRKRGAAEQTDLWRRLGV